LYEAENWSGASFGQLMKSGFGSARGTLLLNHK